jgi:ankyrin repeat protein
VQGKITALLGYLKRHPDGAFLAETDAAGRIPLMLAAANAHNDCMRVLIRAGSAVNDVDDDGYSPLALYVSAENATPRGLRLLLRAGADRTWIGLDGCTCLHLCAARDRGDLIEELMHCLSKGDGEGDGVFGDEGLTTDDKQQSEAQALSDEQEGEQDSTWRRACMILDQRDAEGWTPLMQAVLHGSAQATEVLLSCGSNARLCNAARSVGEKQRDEDGEMLTQGGFEGDTQKNENTNSHAKNDVTEPEGANICGPDINVLHLAAQIDAPERILRTLCESMREVDNPLLLCGDIEGTTPLMIAANQGHVLSVRTLIALNADVGRKDKAGRTALHAAVVRAKNAECVGTLLERMGRYEGATVLDADGLSPIYHAMCTPGCFPHLRILCEDLKSQRTFDDHTLLYTCAYWGLKENVTALIRAKCNVSEPSGAGNVTPLMTACARGHVEIVKLLLEAGADVASRDAEGLTAWHHGVLPGTEQSRNCLLALLQSSKGGLMVDLPELSASCMSCAYLVFVLICSCVLVVRAISKDGNVMCTAQCFGSRVLVWVVSG